MVFFAVAREGLESVFFLLAIFQQSPGPAAPLGALLGHRCVAGAVGYAIFVGGVRLDLRRFFRWTGVFILVVAAGILAGSCARAARGRVCGITCRPPPSTSARVLPADSGLGTVLAGLLGYSDRPAVGEVVHLPAVPGRHPLFVPG